MKNLIIAYGVSMLTILTVGVTAEADQREVVIDAHEGYVIWFVDDEHPLPCSEEEASVWSSEVAARRCVALHDMRFVKGA